MTGQAVEIVRAGSVLRRRPNMGPLSGRVAMVTGCARERGFGRAIALQFAKLGANLLVTDVHLRGNKVVDTKPESAKSGLDVVAREIEQHGREAMYEIMDVRSSSDVSTTVNSAVERFGRLDILVNNAAAAPGPDRVPMVELSEEAWDNVLDTNLKGAFLCARVAATLMLKQGGPGRVINIASVTGKIPYRNMAAYSASKAGLLGLTRAMALELAPAQITVNAICPGVADTDRIDYVGRRQDGSFDDALRSERLRERAATIPLGRVAAPSDVAAVAAFLASDDAAYLTGEFINVAGGSVMD